MKPFKFPLDRSDFWPQTHRPDSFPSISRVVRPENRSSLASPRCVIKKSDVAAASNPLKTIKIRMATSSSNPNVANHEWMEVDNQKEQNEFISSADYRSTEPCFKHHRTAHHSQNQNPILKEDFMLDQTGVFSPPFGPMLLLILLHAYCTHRLLCINGHVSVGAAMPWIYLSPGSSETTSCARRANNAWIKRASPCRGYHHQRGPQSVAAHSTD